MEQLLKEAHIDAENRREMLTVKAQRRWHRRFDKYASVVREQGDEKEGLPWKEAKQLPEWTRVREASKLIDRLRGKEKVSRHTGFRQGGRMRGHK